jgi:hypothetical protein
MWNTPRLFDFQFTLQLSFFARNSRKESSQKLIFPTRHAFAYNAAGEFGNPVLALSFFPAQSFHIQPPGVAVPFDHTPR